MKYTSKVNFTHGSTKYFKGEIYDEFPVKYAAVFEPIQEEATNEKKKEFRVRK
jgi:hypothetical protein